MTEIRAEIVKARSTRTVAALCAGAVGIVILGAVSTVSSASPGDLTGPPHAQAWFTLGAINLSMFAGLLGVRSVTDEFRHGTISWTLLTVRSRGRVVMAKAVVSALSGWVMTATSMLAGAAIAISLARAKGGSLDLVRGDLYHGFRLGAAVVLWAALGLAVGTLVRHQVAAVVGVLVWVLVVENVLSALWRDIAALLPVQAGLALAGAEITDAMAPVPAGLLLLAQVAVLGGAAVASLDRRPVPAPA